MRTITKRLWTAVLCAVFALSFCLFSSALSTNEYGLGFSVKAEETDTSALSLKLKNSNGFDVNCVCIDLDIPQGLDLQAAKSGSDGYSMLVDTLKAGDTYEAKLAFTQTDTAPASASLSEESNSVLSTVLAVIGTVAAVAVIAVLAIRKKKAAAFMLAVLMVLPCAGIFGVHAVGTEDMRSFTLEESITVNGKSYPVLFTVSYLANSAKNSYFDFDVNEDTVLSSGEAMTRLTTDLSGTATANGKVSAVTYSVKSDATGNTETGSAELDGCDWSIENLALVPGENEVVVKAELENGDIQTKTYNLTYDRGELYTAKNSEVREEDGVRYIENVINIYFETGVTDERMNEILSESSLVRIGESNSIFLVQARANEDSLEALQAKCAEVQAYDEVCLAITEDVIDIELNTAPDDPWYYDSSLYTETWNESKPSGNNWSVEAVEALSAWEYESYFGTAKVGIVDGGVKTDHEDFADGLISFPATIYQTGNDAGQHGTHVSGIIGATRNNGIGISGLLSDVEIYAASYTVGNSTDTVTNVIDAVTAEVEYGAKAVNLSLGVSKGSGSDTYNPYLDTFSAYELAQTAGPCAVGMNSLLAQGKEFVVVQSAGNGNIDTRIGVASYRSDDAVQNCLYCAVTPDGYLYPRYYGSLTANAIQQVYNRIIVVGAVQRIYSGGQVKLYMWERSNGGDRVDIYAPGKTVYSSITDTVQDDITYKYAFMSGTSQAAPIVTAVAAMCFAINPDFTGEQVKNIICDEANSTHTAFDYSLTTTTSDGTVLDYHPFEGDGRVVSMKLCAEASLRYVCDKANYRYFNQIMAAVQSLNPEDYTNYEVVQEVLDTIDDSFYNLYEFEQDKVTAKANELIAAMDKLEERGAADYTDVEKAKAEAAALNASDYVDFSGVTAAVNAVVYGKYADEQAEVDRMAQNIRDAIAALEALVSLTSIDSNVVADNTEKIVVVSPDYADDLAAFLSAGPWTVCHTPNSYGNYSTGSIITLTDANGNISDTTYSVVTVGDINGDAKADGEDAFIVSLCMSGMLSASQATELIALDADCSGTVDEDDFDLLVRCGLFEDSIVNMYQEAAE